MKVRDIYLMEFNDDVLLWKVISINLGALSQEGIVQLCPLGKDKAEVPGYGEISSFVPIQMLDAMIENGLLKLVYSKGD